MADIVYHNFFLEMAKGDIDTDTDTFKCALVTSSYTANADHTAWSDASANELSNANGYTTGGDTVTVTATDDDTNDLFKFDITDPTWTASGGAIGPCRHGIVYDDTHASDALIYDIDFTSDQTASDGADFTIQIDADGLFTVAQA